MIIYVILHTLFNLSVQLSSVHSLSRVQLFVTPWTAARQASLSITNSQSSLRFTSIESVMPSSHLILCGPLLLRPSVFPSIRVFSNESALWIRWPKFWSFSFNINPSDCSRRDSQKVFSNTRVLSINSSVLSVFIVQLSHPYMNAGKTIALTRQTFVDKVMSLLFNMLSRLDITFLPRSKCLLISWLQSPSAVIWSPPK